MAAYRADIEIGVKGVQQLQSVTKQIDTLSSGVDSLNKRLAGATQSINAYNANLAKAAATLNKVNAGTVAETEAVRQYVQALGQSNAARDRQNKLIQQQIALQRKPVPTANAGFGVQGPSPAAQTATRGGRGGEALGNALIGGAFPLLFGQGAGAAVGGGLGGAIGGVLGGQFGFGLSLVGTAIGQAIDDAKKLNQELNSLNNNLSTAGSTSRTTASDISQLASQLGIAKDEALKIVAAFSEFASANVREALATSFGAVGGEEAFNALAAAIDNKSTLEAIVKLRDTITDTQAKEALKQLEINGSATANIFLQERLLQLQEQKLIKQAEEVRFMDRLLAAAAALGAQGQFIDPAIFGQERANEVRKGAAERKKAQDQALNDTRNFLSEVARLNEQFSAKTKRTAKGPKPPEDRTAALQADLQAIIEIGNAEDLIRDLRFQGRDLLVPTVELSKTLADIERDRVQGIRNANYETERATVNKIAQARATNAQRKSEDEIREIEKRRAENYASVLRTVEYEIQLTNGRISNTEQQVTIEQKIADLKREQTYLSDADIQKYRQLLELANARKDVEEVINIQRETQATGRGLRAGFIGPAGEAFEQQLAAGKSVARAAEIAQLTEQLQLAQVQAQALEGAVINIGNAFGAAMTTGVAELVKGTKSAQQVFSEFLNAVGQALLDAAGQMIATYIAIGIAKIFAGFGGGGMFEGAGPVQMPGGGGFAEGFSLPNLLPGRASGGPVANNTPYMVGERGPELFVPNSGGSIVNNKDLRSAMSNGGGSAGGTVLNMSFETTNIGGVEYVSRDQLEAAMAATRRDAARDGAKRGMSMTLDKLQQSPGTRGRVGLR